jgi:hypothetical protein
MKSLLEKLGGSKNETRQENVAQNPQAENPQGKPTAASPCRTCGSHIAWWDVYGGGPHCHKCRSWPAEAFVRMVAVADPDSGRWLTFADANRKLLHSESQNEPEASCGHLRARNVARYFVVADESRVSVDRNRLAEAEYFRECLDCGELFERIAME